MPDEATHQGGRGSRPSPKGRQVDAVALAEVRALLGDRERRRDLLIEHLHLLNDAHGFLSRRHMAALAAEMRLSQAEVHEVASFYAHFRIADEDADAALPVVRVCDGIACMLAGAAARKAALEREFAGIARVESAPCIGACDRAPAVVAGFRTVADLGAATLRAAAPAREVAPAAADVALAAARAGGAYRLLAACRDGTLGREDVFAALDAAGLRGLGGAGFPTGRKWRLVAAQPAPRLMAVNADEGEPGTFKDRWFMESAPHRVLEAALIAAWAVGCEAIYLYVRDEYPEAREALAAALGALSRAGLDGGVRIELRRGAGAYVCGEESAMLSSIADSSPQT